MADTTSLILQSFDTAVRCFRAVRAFKNSTKDCNDLLDQLSFVEVRFTRWGECIGINNPADPETRHGTNMDESQQRFLLTHLTKLEDDFEDARKRWQGLPEQKREKHASNIASTSLPRQALLKTATTISNTRHKLTNLGEQVMWVVVGREELATLLQRVDLKVSYLTQICPAPGEELLLSVQKELGQLRMSMANSDLPQMQWRDAFDTLREACRNDALLMMGLEDNAKAKEESVLDYVFNKALYENTNARIGPDVGWTGQGAKRQTYTFESPVHRGGNVHIGPS